MDSFSPDDMDGQPPRRERAAIAAQACETCRQRKSKCDERRPKCSSCQRSGNECIYREPAPTKKDKTLVEILESLRRLENKFDFVIPSGTNVVTSQSRLTSGSRGSSSQASLMKTTPHSDSVEARDSDSLYHITAPHKILLWPSIYVYLRNSGIPVASDLDSILREGTSWFIKQEMARHPNPLPADERLPCVTMDDITQPSNGAARVSFPSLSIQVVQRLTDAYFKTFNLLFPILDRDYFWNNIVNNLINEGYTDGDPNTVLALMVFALGQVAEEGTKGNPINVNDSKQSGIRGGTADRPPGLAIFNEARRRLGFVSTQCELENVQILLLQAIYLESSARHIDFWRSTVAASDACQVLIKCQSIDWSTPLGDLIKRTYWSCVLCEDFFHLELDLPRSGISDLDGSVPVEYSHIPKGGNADDRSHYQFHFVAMINLRILIARIHEVIHESEATNILSGERRTSETSRGDYGGPPLGVIREMARQLENWRVVLPRSLQFTDNDKFEYPANNDPLSRRPNEPLFAPDMGPVPFPHTYNLDILTGQLRTRFYYARYMIYRPFIYKALHFPEYMTTEDTKYCALAIESVCLWPMAFAPPKDKKRLVPHLFAWTQNFLGILLILRMTVENEFLRKVCENHTNQQDIQRTAMLLLEWIQDAQQMDAIAEWSWKLIEPLYSQWDGPTSKRRRTDGH